MKFETKYFPKKGQRNLQHKFSSRRFLAPTRLPISNANSQSYSQAQIAEMDKQERVLSSFKNNAAFSSDSLPQCHPYTKPNGKGFSSRRANTKYETDCDGLDVVPLNIFETTSYLWAYNNSLISGQKFYSKMK